MKRRITGRILQGILLINGIVLLLTCGLFFVYEYSVFREARIDEMFSISRIIGANATAALAFHDQQAAEEILNALRQSPDITSACLYDETGHLFASYPSQVESFTPTPGAIGFNFVRDGVDGFQPVMLDDKLVGTLYLHGNLDAFFQRLFVYTVLAAAILALSSLVTYLLYKMLKHRMLKEVAIQTNDLRESQATILAFNQQLEERVLERTAQLQAVNNELESFSYSVSHDLRAPLRSVHGYLNIINEEYLDKFDEEGRRILTIVTRSAKHMGQLIDDLLEFSRLGRKDLSRKEIAMEEMVKTVCEEQKYQDGNTTFVIHQIPAAKGDHAMIRQVWTNLISNAVKYSRKASNPVVEVGTINHEGRAVYYVKDNGAGFDMKYYDKLFGVFQRLHSAKDFEGIGVGLAIVSRVITRHGGKVWAEGVLGEGATFYFTLGN